MTYELEELCSHSTQSSQGRVTDGTTNAYHYEPGLGNDDALRDPFGLLKDHMLDLDRVAIRNLDTVHSLTAPGVQQPVGAVREEIGWERIRILSAAILELVDSREQSSQQIPEYYPPEYSAQESVFPPSYQISARTDVHHEGHGVGTTTQSYDRKDTSSEKQQLQPDTTQETTTPSSSNEKMLRDFDDLSTAIERLRPRLQDQRSELRPTRSRDLAELQKRMEMDKMRELDDIWRLIERTNGKRTQRGDQRVSAEDIEERREARVGIIIEGNGGELTTAETVL